MADGLADRMRVRTRALHTEAERSGIVARMIAGTVEHSGYRLYLQNLLPVYRSLEEAIERCRATPAVAAIFRPELARAPALAADIEALGGAAAGQESVILPASRRLAGRIAEIGRTTGGEALIAHAYTRYLGDLSGGQILARRMAQSLGLEPSALRFFDFPDGVASASSIGGFRAAFDRAGDLAQDPDAIVMESETAFALNIEISREVEAAVIRHPARDVTTTASIDAKCKQPFGRSAS